jgi:hypothetical protein
MEYQVEWSHGVRAVGRVARVVCGEALCLWTQELTATCVTLDLRMGGLCALLEWSQCRSLTGLYLAVS